MRAYAAFDDRPGFKGSDCYAEFFLPEEYRKPLHDPAARAWVIKNKLVPGMYEFMFARTAFFDGVVAGAFRQNIPQIVFLGAGYDSRPYRFAELARGTRVFELDVAPTQQRKIQMLRQANIPVPQHVVFAPIDLTRDSLKEVLSGAGYDCRQATLFVWEGVTYYLSARAVDETLSFVASNSPAGSAICFDYAALSREALSESGVKQVREMIGSTSPAEATRFGIPAGTIAEFLTARGLRVVEHLTRDEIAGKFLPAGDEATSAKLPALLCFVHAAVSG